MKALCRSCGAAILWAVTKLGRSIPVDADPSPDENVLLFESLGVTHARIASETTEKVVLDALRKGQAKHKSHFATCPNAREHRRVRA